MVVDRKFFGTNGIRGIPSTDLTLEFVIEISKAMGTYFYEGPILIGYDGRSSNVMLSKAVSSGLMSVGIDVAEAGLTPTPALQYGVKSLGYKGGVMITASHNPPQYNGLKVVGKDGVEIRREDESEIEKVYFRKQYKQINWKSFGTSSSENSVLLKYIEGILSKVEVDKIKNKNLVAVLDPGNGVSVLTAPRTLEKIGCKIIKINDTIDSAFSGRGPEPIPDLLKDLSDAVVSNGADLGIAYDGDGDRAIFCDENGTIHWGDKTGALLLDYLLPKNPNTQVVTPVSSSKLIYDTVKKHNSNIISTRVGSVDVSRAMIINKSLFGLEENGGFFYAPHIPVRDGLMTTALILETLSKSELTFSEMLKKLPEYYQKKTKFSCPNDLKTKVMQEIDRNLDGKVERIDGVKIWINKDSWVLLRPSGTEPKIRIFAESNDDKKVDEIMEKYMLLLKKILEKNKK
jgi:phosphomannomutase/phosphoglucomutase